MAQDENNLLQKLCEQASQELDPGKLLELTKKINAVLSEKHQSEGADGGGKKIA